MDGRDALPDQTPQKRQNRDELVGSRLQYPKNDLYPRNKGTHQSDPSLKEKLALE